MSTKFKHYLLDNDISPEAFSKMIKTPQNTVRSNTIRRYMEGTRIPKKPVMQQIYIVTHGFITPNDFYELPDLGKLNK